MINNMHPHAGRKRNQSCADFGRPRESSRSDARDLSRPASRCSDWRNLCAFTCAGHRPQPKPNECSCASPTFAMPSNSSTTSILSSSALVLLSASRPLLNSGNVFSANERASLASKGAIGDICLQYFNSDGEILSTPLADRVIGIKFLQLKKIKHVIGIAGGKRKIDAIRGALSGRWINVLVTRSRHRQSDSGSQAITSIYPLAPSPALCFKGNVLTSYKLDSTMPAANWPICFYLEGFSDNLK